MRLNLLWPAWARLLVSRPVGSASDPIRWRLIRRAARLMADSIEREQQSRAIPPWHRHIWVHQPELRETSCLLCWVHIPMRRFYKRTWVMGR